MARYVAECQECGRVAEVSDSYGLPWAWVRVSAPRWLFFRRDMDFCSLACLAKFLIGQETEILAAGVYAQPERNPAPGPPPPPTRPVHP